MFYCQIINFLLLVMLHLTLINETVLFFVCNLSFCVGWCGEIRDVIFSDNGSVTVVYRVTIRGSDGEVCILHSDRNGILTDLKCVNTKLKFPLFQLCYVPIVLIILYRLVWFGFSPFMCCSYC